jgi:hypothetical protein
MLKTTLDMDVVENDAGESFLQPLTTTSVY